MKSRAALQGSWAWWLVGLLTAAGFALRLHQYGESLMGDEMSTLWIVTGHNLAGTVSQVSGDAEITPPLSFILSWLATKLGSDPNLIRLPSLLAGTALIPLVFLLGRRTVGAVAGLLGAAIVALSPFMIYFSGNGRGYMVLVFFLAASTLVMLKAAEAERPLGWWTLYGVLSCLAMYTHYTAIFVLLAQYLWLVWFVPAARRPATIANLGAALLFVPWLSGLFADLDSPTQPILEALQGKGFEAKRVAFEQWLFGHPLLPPSSLPGKLAIIAIVVSLLLALGYRLWHREGSPSEPAGSEGERTTEHGLVLVLAIALATPVAEGLLALVGVDLLGSRNLTASLYGYGLAAGAIVAMPGGAVSLLASVLILFGYGVGALKTLQPKAGNLDAEAAARVIDDQRSPGDVVVNWFDPRSTPAPLLPLSVYMSSGKVNYSPGMPKGDPPFLPFTSEGEAPGRTLDRAFRRARGKRLFFFTSDDRGSRELLRRLPVGSKVIGSREFPGSIPARLYTVEVGGNAAN